jgi:hypothetical protein
MDCGSRHDGLATRLQEGRSHKEQGDNRNYVHRAPILTRVTRTRVPELPSTSRCLGATLPSPDKEVEEAPIR